MPGNFKKEDLRVLKTHKYLRKALESLLERKKFKHITVNDLCEEALISRAAFYLHFKDKYDLLESWLSELAKKYYDIETAVVLDMLIYDNSKWIKNIVYEADNETYAIVHKFIVETTEALFVENGTDKSGYEYIIFSNFFVGGVLRLLLWQIDNGYPAELHNTKDYLKRLLESFIEWDSKNRTEPKKLN